uniref:MORN-repeat protein n=1 Tax=viral metagenome TaxID=1070528 RepID=A0A6C0EEC8_9ZZZZ
MATLEQLEEKCMNYVDNPLYGFKNCANCLVILKKTPKTITNEDRSDVVDKKYAKFRANKFIVEKIIHMKTLRELTEIKNTIFSNKRLVYTVGKKIYDKSYDKNIDNVYSAGIHYYLSIEPAMSTNSRTGNNNVFYDDGTKWRVTKYDDGTTVLRRQIVIHDAIGTIGAEERYENGQIKLQCKFNNGQRDGKCKEFFEDGSIKLECEYINGNYNGKYIEYYENKTPKIECMYTNGNKDGDYKEWYENENKKIQCVYRGGYKHGKYEEWFSSGKRRCEKWYQDGELNGHFVMWHGNEKKFVECDYSYGKLDGKYEEWNNKGEKIVECDYDNGKRET